MKGRLIVFEGIDGVGKTTVSKALTRELRARGIPAIRYEDTEHQKRGFNLLKPFIQKKAPIDASAFFYLASAVYKSKRIEALLKTQWVICDRYIYSTLAYHAVHGSKVMKIVPYRRLGIRMPDITFLLRLSEKMRLERARVRKIAKPHDKVSKRQDPRINKMESMLKNFNPVIVDNSGNIKATISHILRALYL